MGQWLGTLYKKLQTTSHRYRLELTRWTLTSRKEKTSLSNYCLRLAKEWDKSTKELPRYRMI